jgi:hypothetical protein
MIDLNNALGVFFALIGGPLICICVILICGKKEN